MPRKHPSGAKREPSGPLDPAGARNPRLLRYVEELKAMVRSAHPEARFGPLTYVPTEGLWMVEAYTASEDQLAVAELTSQREAELLVEEGVCVAMIPMPLALWTDDLAGEHGETPGTTHPMRQGATPEQDGGRPGQ